MKIAKYFLIITLFTNISFAQNKKFTIEDVAVNSYTTLAAEKLEQLSWIPNSNDVSFIEDSVLVKVNIETGEKIDLLSLDELKSQLKFGNEYDCFPTISWSDKHNFSFWNDSVFYSYSIKDQKLEVLNRILSSGENIIASPNLENVAFTMENNLYVALKNNNIKQITDEENKEIVSGQTVSRNEFGFNMGIFWSPKNKFLAFYQKDETEVTNYPIVKIGTTPAVVENTKYPMVGQASEVIKVGIYDILNDKTIWLNTPGEKNQYLTNISWDPSEKYIYIAHLNRD